MSFENSRIIYEQMADRFCDGIMAGTYRADDRIPSVRGYAVVLQVNTSTAMKAYELLSREEIIYNRRGLGYSVSASIREQIMTARYKTFLIQPLPSVFHEMKLLEIATEDIEREWERVQR